MSLHLSGQEVAMSKNVIERLSDLDCLKLIINTNFCPGHDHEKELNAYKRELILHNMLAPLCFWFFSSRHSFGYDVDRTEQDLERFLRHWLTEPNFSWGMTKRLTNPDPKVTMTWTSSIIKPKKRKAKVKTK